ncbi:hypothetical protein ACLMJK_000886 [Lecanora helva]
MANAMIVLRLFLLALLGTGDALIIPGTPSILPLWSKNLTIATSENATFAANLTTYPHLPLQEWIFEPFDSFIFINHIWPAYGDTAYSERVLDDIAFIQSTKFPIGGKAWLTKAHATKDFVTFNLRVFEGEMDVNEVCGVLQAVWRVMGQYGAASMSARYVRFGLDKAQFEVYLSGG